MDGGRRRVPRAAEPGEPLDAAPRQPRACLALPVELEVGGADDHRREGVVGLERGERLDRLAEALLVGEERAPALQQVGDPGALEGLELAAEAIHVELRVVSGRQLDQPGRAGVLLARLLEQLERAGLHPDAVLVEEAVELGDAEGVGADRGQRSVVGARRARICAAARRGAGARDERTVEARELVQQLRTVAGRKHERRLLVDRGAFEHGRRRRAPVLERLAAAARRRADPAVELGARQAPRLERQRQRRTAGRLHRSLADRARQPVGLAEQHQPRLLPRARGSLDVDVAPPAADAGEPRAHALLDRRVLEVGEHFLQRLRVALARCQPHAPAGALGVAQAGAPRQSSDERRPSPGDEDPVLAAAVSAELDVRPRLRAGSRARRRALGLGALALAQRLAGGLAETNPRVTQRADRRGRVVVQRHVRAPDRVQPLSLGVVEQPPEELRGTVRREAQPPALVRPREVDQALAASAAATAAVDRPRQSLLDVRRRGQAGEQPRERLGLLGFQRHAPDALLGVPAPPRDRAQQLPQVLVIGEAENRLVALERCCEGCAWHGPCTIGTGGDLSRGCVL